MYAHETSTIDYEYQSKDKVKTWLEMATVDEEHSSIFSPSIPDEEILDCVTHGHSIKSHNINVVSMQDHDAGFYYTSNTTDHENYSAMTKNDTGYYSGDDNESLVHDNGSYISEKAAFHTPKKTTYISPQQESRLDKVIEEEEPIQCEPSQISVTSPNANGYVTLEDQHLSHTQNAMGITNGYKGQTDYIPNNTTSSSQTEVPVEETKENNVLPTNLEGDYFPYTTAEIYPTSDSLTSPTLIGDKNKDSPVISEGEYFPYTTAVSQYGSSAVTMLSEKSTTEATCEASMESSVKQEPPPAVTDSLPYVTLNEDNSSYVPLDHNNYCADQNTTIDITDRYTTDIPCSESCSLFPDTTVQAQDQYIDRDHQYTVNQA